MRTKVLFLCALVATLVASAAPAAGTHDPAMGVFVDESSRVPFVPDAETLVTHVAFIDFDLDGDRDFFLTRGGLDGVADATNQVFRNDGGTFRLVQLAGRVLSDYTHVAFGDVNGDARLDAVLSTNVAIERLLLWNVTRSRWSDKTKLMPPGQPATVTISSEFFDADGDGDLDIMAFNEDPFTTPGAQNRLYLNDGTGRFTDATGNLPAILDDSSAGAIADFDADGDPDVIVVNAGPFVYLVNDGTAHFTDQTAGHLPAQPANRDSGRDAVVADFDADGDLDAAFAISRSDEGPLLWLNDGSGHFTDATSTHVPVATLTTQALAACDLEGDGDTDLVLADSGPVLVPPTDHRFAGAPERILVNDGTGHFSDVTAEHMPLVVDGSQTIACGDIDGDADPDLIVGNGKGESLRVYVQS